MTMNLPSAAAKSQPALQYAQSKKDPEAHETGSPMEKQASGAAPAEADSSSPKIKLKIKIPKDTGSFG